MSITFERNKSDSRLAILIKAHCNNSKYEKDEPMKKLPTNLYHYTSPIQMEFIREDGYIKLTDSNLKMDEATYRVEPMYRNGKIIGEHAVNKYSNYHPVVWLTIRYNNLRKKK